MRQIVTGRPLPTQETNRRLLWRARIPSWSDRWLWAHGLPQLRPRWQHRRQRHHPQKRCHLKQPQVQKRVDLRRKPSCRRHKYHRPQRSTARPHPPPPQRWSINPSGFMSATTADKRGYAAGWLLVRTGAHNLSLRQVGPFKPWISSRLHESTQPSTTPDWSWKPPHWWIDVRCMWRSSNAYHRSARTCISRHKVRQTRRWCILLPVGPPWKSRTWATLSL